MVFSCMKKDIKGQIMSRNDTIGSLMTSSRGSIALGEVTRGHVEGEFQARTEKEQSGLAQNTLWYWWMGSTKEEEDSGKMTKLRAQSMIFFVMKGKFMHLLYILVNYGYNTYLFFGRPIRYVRDVVIYVTAWPYVFLSNWRHLNKQRLVMTELIYWCFFSSSVTNVTIFWICYVWDSVIYIITWMKCPKGFSHSATSRLLRFLSHNPIKTPTFRCHV